MRIAFIGVGAMGAPMAQNLIDAGHTVAVYDVFPELCARLHGPGLRVAASLADVCAGCEVAITMLPSTPHVLEAVLGPEGIAASLPADTVYIDMSTITPVGTRTVYETLQAKGVRMLDCPVSGGVKGAAAGTLTLFIGGEAELVEKMRPILECMGKTLLHMGEVGAGEAAKLVHNICNATLVAAFSEAVVFGTKLGVDPTKMVEALSLGSCANVLRTHVHDQGLRHSFPPSFSVQYMLKDLALAKETAAAVNMPLLYPALSQEVLTMLRAKGLGSGSYAEVIRVFEDFAQVTASLGEEQ